MRAANGVIDGEKNVLQSHQLADLPARIERGRSQVTKTPRRLDPIIWSYGGGVQSAAIAVLIAQGGLPIPDLSVIADTGREASSTWEFLSDRVQPLLDTVGVKVEIAPHSLSTVDLYSGNGDLLSPWVLTVNGLWGMIHP